MSAPEFDYIDDPAGLAEVVASASAADRYALDTEFHREKTYYPKAALVQLAWEDRLAVIDPLAVSLEPLGELLVDGGTAVMHAAVQDLELLDHTCGATPQVLFDTQIAAGFAGMRSPSLAALHDKWLGMRLGKQDRLTDWLRRPLGDQQLSYAIADVSHLLQIHDLLVADLGQRGRLAWAEAECEEVRVRGVAQRDPDEAWARIKETRHLSGEARGVAQAIAAWRERRAAEIDQPPRYILSDLALVAISQRPPRGVDELAKVRGVDERMARGSQGETLLRIIEEGRAQRVETPSGDGRGRNDRSLRPAVTLVSAWIAQHAGDLELDPALLATRSEIEAFLRGDESRLSSGWRAELAGQPIRRLVGGDAALAFDRADGLVLEARSRRPLGGDARS